MLTAIASVFLATWLAGCVHSERPPAGRITLPTVPRDLAPCFRAPFPAIPDRDLTRADVVGIVGRAKVLDRRKTACGDRAVAWGTRVVESYGRVP